MARVTSDLRSDSAAGRPEWTELGEVDLDAPIAPEQRVSEEEEVASGGTLAEPDTDAEPWLEPRRRLRRGWERGRVWFRPEERPRPDPRPPLRDRLVPPFYPEFFRGAGWILPLIITAIGGFMRFWNLGWPNKIIFDETYYAKDGWSMWVYGWEHTWADGAKISDPALSGSGAFGHNAPTNFTCVQTCAEYVVHPPAGKWIIGLGEKIWGLNPVGWRLMEAVLGTLAIYIIARTARRMFRSTLLGCVAGIFLAFDGLAFVMARTALLDGIQMFFILAGFSALVVDRDKVREKFAAWREERGPGLLPFDEYGPRLGPRPWRLVGGLMLGLATATKWNGIVFLAAFMVMSLLWDGGARRAAGVRYPTFVTLAVLAVFAVPAVLKFLGLAWAFVLLGFIACAVFAVVSMQLAGLLKRFAWRRLAEPLWGFLSMPVLAVGVFVASYAGWFFRTEQGGGYYRTWADGHPSSIWPTWTNPFRSLWFYVGQQYGFNSTLQSGHPYMSNPWSWFIMGRPVAFYWATPPVGQSGCTASMGSCSAEVLALGNPLLWWFATASIFYLLWRWIARRDWRAAAMLTGIAAGVGIWLWYAQRTIFSFYAVSFTPFMVLAATFAVGTLLGRADAPPTRRVWGAAVAGTLVVGVVALFAYFYPIYSGQTIPYSDWSNHMWLPSWI
jgi:dolichyl-phosphate-mannose--protein O-mannosyl transferase